MCTAPLTALGPRSLGPGQTTGTHYQACDGDRNQLQNFNDSEPLGLESPASVSREGEVLNDQGEIRDVANVNLNKANRKVLDQLCD